MASCAPALATRVQSWRVVRTILNRLMGLHPARPLPAFSAPLPRWLRARRSAGNRDERPVVLLQPDCFTLYNESHIGQAAVHVLEAFGYRVVLADGGCCGRAQISTGLLPAAIRTINRTVAAHAEALRRSNAVAIVGLEPSCVSAAKDDWLELRLTHDAGTVQAVSDQILPIERFLEERWEQHPVRPVVAMSDPLAPIVVHGHCHQKALWGTHALTALLERLTPEGQVIETLDSGCCGMAGSFGYAAHRYDLSMRIAEDALFRHVREREGDILVAPGTSCRHQVADGLGRRAVHPVELLAQLVSAQAAT